MKHEINISSMFWEMYFEISDEYEKRLCDEHIKLEIKKMQEKGIELSKEEIKKLEEKIYNEYMNSNGRNLSKEDRIKYIEEQSAKAIQKEKERLKEQHSCNNSKNINKEYSIEKKLCKKYLVDNADKMFLLIVEIREVYNKKSLLKFIRLMYIYEKALELGLINKSMEETFDEYICERYKEYVDCFEDVRRAIMDFEC